MRHSDDQMVRDRADLNIRANREWVAWLNKLAKRERVSTAGLIDQLTARRAMELGHDSPPLRCGR